ncbi:MAG: hypothetical protein OXH09_16450, partial [Gammaproteobacteria bacterium]|nr:hypothetical protein [Gammaproteobacteria bacterium]
GATYDEAIAYRNQREKVRRKAVAGVVGITAGLVGQTRDRPMTRYAGAVSVIGGATLAVSAIRDLDKAKSHANALRELGVSAGAGISPHTIELENRTFNLQGTVETQLKELRQILRTLYYRELGLPPPDPQVLAAVSTAEDSLEAAVGAAASPEAR